MAQFYCERHQRLEDSDVVSYVETDDGDGYCAEGFDEMMEENEREAAERDLPPDPWEGE